MKKQQPRYVVSNNSKDHYCHTVSGSLFLTRFIQGICLRSLRCSFSCFLLTMHSDSIEGIYDTLKQCALISKSAGGIGVNVHCIRASGTYIAGVRAPVISSTVNTNINNSSGTSLNWTQFNKTTLN